MKEGWNRQDSMRFIRKLTFKKLVNAFLVYSSYQLTKILRKPTQWGQPFTISFEPTTACNLRCPECPSGLRSFSRKTGNLKEDFFRSTIDDIADQLLYLIFYFQGEPYINPKFLDMVKHAHDRGIYTITSTNGHFLDDDAAKATIESGLDRIIISIDGTTQEVYEQYRKEGKLDSVIAGTKRLVAWKKKLNVSHPHIIFQYLVVKPNEHQIPEVYKLAEELGVDEVRLKTAQVYDYKNGNKLIPDNEFYSRYKLKADGTYGLKYKITNNCWKLWHSCVITWDGMVVPCCFDKDAQHEMGKLQTQSLKEIWASDSYQDFRMKLLDDRASIDICSNCSEGCKVWEEVGA